MKYTYSAEESRSMVSIFWKTAEGSSLKMGKLRTSLWKQTNNVKGLLHHNLTTRSSLKNHLWPTTLYPSRRRKGCALTEPGCPSRLTFELGLLQNICCAPWISQVQSTGLPSIFLRAWPWEGAHPHLALITKNDTLLGVWFLNTVLYTIVQFLIKNYRWMQTLMTHSCRISLDIK